MDNPENIPQKIKKKLQVSKVQEFSTFLLTKVRCPAILMV